MMGATSILYSVDGNVRMAQAFILLAMIADGIDGQVARHMNATSETGRDIDAIADMISFSIAPAILLYSAYYRPEMGPSYRVFLMGADLSIFRNPLTVLASLEAMTFGILRLVRFRSSDERTDRYMGLPTAAFAYLVVVSIGLLPMYAAILLAILAGMLMISNLKYPKLTGIYYWVGGSAVLLALLSLAIQQLQIYLWTACAIMLSLYMLAPLSEKFINP